MKQLLTLFILFCSNPLWAQMADSLAKPKQIIAQNSDFATTAFLYENGRINLVVFVIATIFAGIILYLIRIERKLNKLEKK